VSDPFALTCQLSTIPRTTYRFLRTDTSSEEQKSSRYSTRSCWGTQAAKRCRLSDSVGLGRHS
jgi:hypothetical protein